MEIGGQLQSLLAVLEPPTPSFTLFELADDVRLIGLPLDGVAALVVLSGTLHLTDGREMRAVKPGRVALLPPGRRASIAASPGEPAHSADGRASLTRRDRWLVADATRGRPVSLSLAATRIAGSDALDAPVVISIADCSVGRPIFTLLRAELARGAEGHPALAMSLMSACVVQALRRAIIAAPDAAPSQADAAAGASVGRAVAAIRARPGEPHTLDSLADVAGMSRSTFIRHFRRVMRLPPIEFLQRVRLEEGRAMLRATTLPVKTVAARAGFASRSHFSRLFRSAFGDDPTSYRQGGDDQAAA